MGGGFGVFADRGCRGVKEKVLVPFDIRLVAIQDLTDDRNPVFGDTETVHELPWIWSIVFAKTESHIQGSLIIVEVIFPVY